jgi:Oxidoreductase family, NAD-binding Rossmann fold.
MGAAQDSPSVSIAILGLGRWGMHLLRNFLALSGVRVVAIADPNASRLHAAVVKFGLEHHTPRRVCLHDWAAALGLERARGSGDRHPQPAPMQTC